MAGWLQLYAAPDSADFLVHGVPLGNNIQALGFKFKVGELGLQTFGLQPSSFSRLLLRESRSLEYSDFP